MEKYYCEHCRILYDREETCKICGMTAKKKIKIEVQKHEKQ